MIFIEAFEEIRIENDHQAFQANKNEDQGQENLEGEFENLLDSHELKVQSVAPLRNPAAWRRRWQFANSEALRQRLCDSRIVAANAQTLETQVAAALVTCSGHRGM